MEKNDLKSLLKPVIKECMREVLLEAGLLNKTEELPKKTGIQKFQESLRAAPAVKNTKQEEPKSRLIEEVRNSRFIPKKFDPFAGTKALTEAQANGSGAGSDIDPEDPGIDLSNIASLVGNSKAILNAMNGKKG